LSILDTGWGGAIRLLFWDSVISLRPALLKGIGRPVRPGGRMPEAMVDFGIVSKHGKDGHEDKKHLPDSRWDPLRQDNLKKVHKH
jgi:hypothetical protein